MRDRVWRWACECERKTKDRRWTIVAPGVPAGRWPRSARAPQPSRPSPGGSASAGRSWERSATSRTGSRPSCTQRSERSGRRGPESSARRTFPAAGPGPYPPVSRIWKNLVPGNSILPQVKVSKENNMHVRRQTLMPGMKPRFLISSTNGVPSSAFWRKVSSKRITPPR